MRNSINKNGMGNRKGQCGAEQRQSHARPWLILTLALLISHFPLLICNAQTFTQRLQQKGKAGQGTVNVTQSREIDKLVNGNTTTAQASNKDTRKQTQQADKQADNKNDGTQTKQNGNSSAESNADKSNRPAHDAKGAANGNTAAVDNDNEASRDTTDTRKKVMLGTRKISGYRVQAYAGGNQRNDRVNAEKTGRTIKEAYPDEPVYVHFYSPRWICRVGNYRTYEEAHQMLINIRKLGFTSASIVKGKIIVTY